MPSPRDGRQRTEQTTMTNQHTVTAIPVRTTNSWAVAAFVLSLFAWQGLVIAITSLIFAIIALDEINQRREGGRAIAQFARAFAILMIITLTVCAGSPVWMAI
jgi:hypothetical protein